MCVCVCVFGCVCFCLFLKEKKNMELGGWAGREDLGGVGGGELDVVGYDSCLYVQGLGCGTVHWNVGNLPVATPSKKS